MPTGIKGFRSAATGTATISYYGNIDKPDASPVLDIFLKARPWSSHEYPPFAWQFIAPLNKRMVPVIKLAVSRDTEIGFLPRKIKYGFINPLKPNAVNPELQIIRTQYSNKRIPSLGDSISAFSIHPIQQAEPPRSLLSIGKGGRQNLGRIRAKTVTIVNIPSFSSQIKGKRVRSTFITQNDGNFGIRIYIKNPLKPARYHYWLANLHTTTLEFVITVVHDDNVEVKSIRSTLKDRPFRRGQVPLVKTFAYEVNRLDSFRIPYQDQDFLDLKNINDKKILDKLEKKRPLRNKRPDGEFKRELVNTAEDVISLVPLVNDLYDVGTLAYTAKTGKRAWVGDKVTRSQQAAMAGLILLPLVPSARSILRKAKAVSDPELDALMQKILKEDTAEAISFEIIAVASSLSKKEQGDLAVQLTEVFKKEGKKLKPKIFAKRLFDSLEKHARLDTPQKRYEAIKGSIIEIEKVLDDSLLDFSDPILSKKYKEDLKKLGATPEEFTPTTWARKRSRGQHADIMRKKLGKNFAGVMRFIEQGKSTKKKVKVRANTHVVYDNFILKIMPYEEIKIKGHGYALERDHLIEKRFFLNLPHVEASGGEIMFSRGMAVAVPKTHDVADQLGGPRKVLYVHDDKNSALKELLPHGGEQFYSPQAIWDAHVYYYSHLGIDNDILGALLQHLEQEMDNYVDFLSTKSKKAGYIKRIDPSDAAFNPDRYKDPFWWKKT